MKNKYEIRGDVTAIFLKSKKFGDRETIIDTIDLEKVKSFPTTWYPNYYTSTKSFYVIGHFPIMNGKQETISMHRFITNAQKSIQVDHFNHDTLDNRRSVNLREVTNAENKQNLIKARSDSKSGILGVSWYKNHKKWVSKFMLNGKKIHLGYFDDIQEAERVLKEARAKYFPFSQEAFLTKEGV